MKTEEGFLLTETLVLILILSVAFTALVGVLSEVIKVTARAQQVTVALLSFEDFLFKLETGERADLIDYGGQGDLSGNYHYEIRTKELHKGVKNLEMTLSWHHGATAMEFDGLYAGASGGV